MLKRKNDMFLKMLVTLVVCGLYGPAYGQTIQNVWQSPKGTPAVHNVFLYLDKVDIGLYGVNKPQPTLEIAPYFASAKQGKWSLRIAADVAVGQNKIQWGGLVLNGKGQIGQVQVALPVYALRDKKNAETLSCPAMRIVTPLSKTASVGIGGKFTFGSGNRSLKLGPVGQLKIGEKETSELRIRWVTPVMGGGDSELRLDWFTKI